MEIKEFSKMMISKYGQLQIIVAIEELSELQKELTKSLRGKDNREHIIEEMADVQLVLDELKEYYNIKQDDIYKVKRNKIIRTEKRYLDQESKNDNDENNEKETIFSLME